MTRAALSALPGAALLGQSWPLRNDVYEVSVSKSAFYPSWSQFHQQGLIYTEVFSLNLFYSLALTRIISASPDESTTVNGFLVFLPQTRQHLT